MRRGVRAPYAAPRYSVGTRGVPVSAAAPLGRGQGTQASFGSMAKSRATWPLDSSLRPNARATQGSYLRASCSARVRVLSPGGSWLTAAMAVWKTTPLSS